jgi:acid phosphatase
LEKIYARRGIVWQGTGNALDSLNQLLSEMPATRLLRVSILLTLPLIAACGQNTPLPEARAIAAELAGKHHFDRILLVVLENEDAKDVSEIPYMDSLAGTGVYLADYYGVAHPSYPNYLALVAGQTFIGSDKAIEDPIAHENRDFGDAQLLIDAPSLAGVLQESKLTWDTFAEDYPITDSIPTRCDFRRNVGLYTRKHVAFLSFKEFHDHPELCAHIRNLKWLRPDSLSAYTLVIPNLIHDGHDAPLATAVKWLRGFLKPIITNTEMMQSTLVVVTFDESATSGREKVFGARRPNLIYTALVGGMLKAGTVSTMPYSHFSTLKMIEENFGLAPGLAPKGTVAIDGVWK